MVQVKVDNSCGEGWGKVGCPEEVQVDSSWKSLGVFKELELQRNCGGGGFW